MTVWQAKRDGACCTSLCRWIVGKWLVSDGRSVIAWFATEADARRFARAA